MKQFVRSVPAILFTGVASLSMIVLAGCDASGSRNSGPTVAKNIYALEYTYNSSTNIVQDSLEVFSAAANGSTTPTSTLTLPSNFEGYSLVIGPNGAIYVGGEQNSSSTEYGEILEYAAGATGSATPTVTLNGSAAGTATFTYPVALAVNSAGTLFVSSDDGTLEAFAAGFTASSAPTQYLNWGQNSFDYTGEPLGVDTAGDIFYVDPGSNGGNGQVDVFAAGATGATAPVRTITGTDTNSFATLEYIAVDGAGDVYLTSYNSSDDPSFPIVQTNPGTYGASKRGRGMTARSAHRSMARPHGVEGSAEPTEIIEFAAGASGNATPLKRIGGSAANIVEPLGLAVDEASNLYYADASGGYYTDDTTPIALEVFAPSASGNVAPSASITATGYTADNSVAVAIH